MDKIFDDIKEEEKVLENRVEVGKAIKEAVRNKMVDPRALSTEYLEAMNTYSDSDDCAGISLKLWQEKLLRDLTPSDRQIIWVVGENGAEGKSFFQQYLVKTIGKHKVFNTTMDKRGDAILHALSKRQVSLIDVFVFNIPRSCEPEDTPYNILEDIKDGCSLSTKYDSKQLKFNTPNIVLVFSNRQPLTYKMSCDRWNIFTIKDGDLKCEIASQHAEKTKKKSWKSKEYDRGYESDSWMD